jgi:hypothetical protein
MPILGIVGIAALAGFIILGITWLLNRRHDSHRAKHPPDEP